MADTFVSYAKEDKRRAQVVAALLHACGWSVFWDVDIGEGEDWRKKIDHELSHARCVLVLWSQTSVDRDWVKEEAEIARRYGILISVLIDKVAPPLGFGTLQAIDLIGWKGGRTTGVRSLVTAVSKKLRRTPRRNFKVPPPPGRTRRIALATALSVSLLAALPVSRWLSKPAPTMNQEIVLDTSEGMNALFDRGQTKLQAAVEAVRVRDLHPDDNLALRRFGGPCYQDESSNLSVSFGTNRRNSIVGAAGAVQPLGEATLASAIVSAMTDLLPLPHTRRIVVLTGHKDACHDDAIRIIKDRLEANKKAGHELGFEFRLIGLGLSPEDQSQVRALGDAVGGNSFFVSTIDELNDVLQYVLEFEPAFANVREVWEIVDGIGKSLTEIANNSNQRKFDEAEGALEAAKGAYRRMRAPFESLADKQITVDFQRFYELASANRTLQERSFELAEKFVRLCRASGETQSDECRASIDSWNETVGQYNGNIGEMNQLSQTIAEESRKTVS